MEIDRRAFIASLGGAAAVAIMTPDEKADALEHYMSERLEEADVMEGLLRESQTQAAGEYPTMADIKERNANLDRPFRRGAGTLMVPKRDGTREFDGKLRVLAPMPEKPTLLDFYKHRFAWTEHCLQSATRALKTGMREEVVLACLLHDVVLAVISPDHGWWGAQMLEPYVPEITSFAIKYHQTLRFYPDEAYGYEYPEGYLRGFGVDYEPEPYLQKTYEMVRNHKYYEHSRLVTVNDLYAFDPDAKVSIEPFLDIMGRHFKQPKEGLGYDNSPVAHMWRTMIQPDRQL
jgi:hypothetical protein